MNIISLVKIKVEAVKMGKGDSNRRIFVVEVAKLCRLPRLTEILRWVREYGGGSSGWRFTIVIFGLEMGVGSCKTLQKFLKSSKWA